MKIDGKIDRDGDGVVSDQELQAASALDTREKLDAQRRMAWVALLSMIGFTIAVFLPLFSDARIKALSDLFGLFTSRRRASLAVTWGCRHGCRNANAAAA